MPVVCYRRSPASLSLRQESVKHPQDQERHWSIVCLTSASSPRFNPAGPSLSELCQHTGMRMETLEVRLNKFGSIPGRKGTRPSTIRGPLHIQCDGIEDTKYLHGLISEVLTWPQIESTPPIVSSPDLISIHLKRSQGANSSRTAAAVREFAKVYLEAPTIYLTLPLATAHWAILRGWGEPHYLASQGLMAAVHCFYMHQGMKVSEKYVVSISLEPRNLHGRHSG